MSMKMHNKSIIFLVIYVTTNLFKLCLKQLNKIHTEDI